MNTNYDCDRAKLLLKRIYDGNDVINEVPSLTSLKVEHTRLQTIKYPPSVRLMSDEDGEEVEVTVRIQGVLCGKTLPPLCQKPLTKSMNHVRNLRQHIKITALGLPEFDQALSAMQGVVDRFKSYIPNSNVTPVEFLPYEGDPSIEAHARYFTDRNLVPFAKNSPFGPDVDAHGILRSIQPDAFIHGPDNYVEYCKLSESDSGINRHTAFNPSLFRVGDIVEAAFSFVGVPVKDGGYRIMLNLRALTLLDATVREDSEKCGKIAEAPAHRAPKRRRLYLQEDEATAPPRAKGRTADGAEDQEREAYQGRGVEEKTVENEERNEEVYEGGNLEMQIDFDRLHC